MKIDESNFLYILTNIRQRLFKFLESELAKENIKEIAPSYGDILFVLDQKGTLTMQEVARHTIKDKSTVSLGRFIKICREQIFICHIGLVQN